MGTSDLHLRDWEASSTSAAAAAASGVAGAEGVVEVVDDGLAEQVGIQDLVRVAYGTYRCR